MTIFRLMKAQHIFFLINVIDVLFVYCENFYTFCRLAIMFICLYLFLMSVLIKCYKKYVTRSSKIPIDSILIKTIVVYYYVL